MIDLKVHDALLADEGPAALVIREFLMPVEGLDGVFFPAGFAPEQNADRDKGKFQGGYNIDEFEDNTNVCLVDSVGSQANRIEPIFARERYRSLVPQVLVQAGEKTIDLLEAGHRAGDALVRSTALQPKLHEAFKAMQTGDATLLAKIAPTSLVFGVWDSRNTQTKAPRLIASTIRAFNVQRLKRSAQYVPAAEYQRDGILPPPGDLGVSEKKYGERGFSHVPAPATHGGVIARGDIRRDATLSLAALRLLTSKGNEQQTIALQRYILGLSIVALTSPQSTYLRQGCNLVLNPDKPREFKLVRGDGSRVDADITPDAALEFALAAAVAFGVGENRTEKFDLKLAKADLDVTADGEATSKPKKK